MPRTPLGKPRSKARPRKPLRRMHWYAKRCFDELEKRLLEGGNRGTRNPTEEAVQVVKKEVEEATSEVVVQLVGKDEVENKFDEAVAVVVKDEFGDSLGEYLGVVVKDGDESLEAEFRNWLLTFEHPKCYIKMRSIDDVRMVFCAVHFRPNMTLFCGYHDRIKWLQRDNVRAEFARLFGICTHVKVLYKIHHDGNKIILEAATAQEMSDYKFYLHGFLPFYPQYRNNRRPTLAEVGAYYPFNLRVPADPRAFLEFHSASWMYAVRENPDSLGIHRPNL